MDTEATIRRTIALIDQCKRLKPGYKSSCEKLVSQAAGFTLSLVRSASEMGVKKFLEDPPPFEPYQ
ncbi:hypothetical protein M407DRAFT_247243 [Tulasnella calospora MUT 4182]|uniref:Uncharacterized protein n=1 Tax=Tulasnella calospora MUT 4182 TaxID=1051891 RepID=A0A0C3Q0F4_9AGAM|nr:hypothetical protein M407DRAFT_247243 [Tulasnella calospora MUT 4182]